MSDSGLKLPSTTELEGRVREALKVAREKRDAARRAYIRDPFDGYHAADAALYRVIRILEDGRS